MSRVRWKVERLRSPAEIPAFARVMAESFGGEPDDQAHWAGRAGHQNILVARAPDGEVVGGLASLPLGMWLAGRVVPCSGISMVVVAPHVRGQGVAKALMRAALEETRSSGRPLSGLYPATLPLYQAVGYGQAGTYCEARVPLAGLGALGHAQRELPVRRYREEDGPAVLALFQRVAARHHGWVQRDTYLWGRVNQNRSGQSERYLLGPEGAPPEGHLGVVRILRDGGLYHDLQLTDVTLETPRAARRFWSFIASHGSVVRDVVWSASAEDPLLGMLPEPCAAVRVAFVWMARVVDVPAALLARGWRPDARGSLALELQDDVLPENSGRWLLRVEGGRAQVERGGSGDLKLGAEGLAGLYTGFRSVEALVQLGLAEASEGAHVAAQALFAGPAPVAQDRY